MSYTNFEVGQTFPLPIRATGDGGLFQIDANGIMFILQLSHTDIIAIEAFRTGKMELALYEEDGLLFLLYQIDGIFREGWGDAPLALYTLSEKQLPDLAKMTDPAIHLYLVDSRLNLLLALRTVPLKEDFFTALKRHTAAQLAEPLEASSHQRRIGAIYQRLSGKKPSLSKKFPSISKMPRSIETKPYKLQKRGCRT